VSVADSPAALAREVDVVCTCVATPAALRDVMEGPEGVLGAARPGTLVIDFSTVAPDDTRALDARCRAAGLAFVEAPVTGSKNGADKGTLLIMVGADAGPLARARPIFEAVGEKVVHCGPVGAGSTVKLAGNALIALMLQGLSEGLLLVQQAGVDPRRFLEVVQASGYRSPYFDFKGPALLARQFETHFALELLVKDLSLFLESARRHGIHAPATRAARDTYALGQLGPEAKQDIGVIIELLERQAGPRRGVTPAPPSEEV
jgi:3-hydroxyisobutyrate dehydrogenase-like beta-hydroxyacid dehydrogenase